MTTSKPVVVHKDDDLSYEVQLILDDGIVKGCIVTRKEKWGGKIVAERVWVLAP